LGLVLVPGLTVGGVPPKFQLQEVGFPEDTSLKPTASGAHPAAGEAFIIATGACADAPQSKMNDKKGVSSSLLFNG